MKQSTMPRDARFPINSSVCRRLDFGGDNFEAEVENFINVTNETVQMQTKKYNFDFTDEIALLGRFLWSRRHSGVGWVTMEVTGRPTNGNAMTPTNSRAAADAAELTPMNSRADAAELTLTTSRAAADGDAAELTPTNSRDAADAAELTPTNSRTAADAADCAPLKKRKMPRDDETSEKKKMPRDGKNNPKRHVRKLMQ